MIKTFVFDFDGTLGNSRGLIVKTLRDTMQSQGFPLPSESECAATIGLPLHEAFRTLLSISLEEAQRCAELYANVYFPRNNQPGAVPPFPGVVETLQTLHRQNCILTVASNRRTPSLLELLGDMGVLSLFSDIISIQDVVHPKPAPDMVVRLLERNVSLSSETMVVGDTPLDIQMGQAAGCATCAVTYGNGNLQDLQAAHPDFLIQSFSEILALIF